MSSWFVLRAALVHKQVVLLQPYCWSYCWYHVYKLWSCCSRIVGLTPRTQTVAFLQPFCGTTCWYHVYKLSSCCSRIVGLPAGEVTGGAAGARGAQLPHLLLHLRWHESGGTQGLPPRGSGGISVSRSAVLLLVVILCCCCCFTAAAAAASVSCCFFLFFSFFFLYLLLLCFRPSVRPCGNYFMGNSNTAFSVHEIHRYYGIIIW